METPNPEVYRARAQRRVDKILSYGCLLLSRGETDEARAFLQPHLFPEPGNPHRQCVAYCLRRGFSTMMKSFENISREEGRGGIENPFFFLPPTQSPSDTEKA